MPRKNFAIGQLICAIFKRPQAITILIGLTLYVTQTKAKQVMASI